MKAPSPMLVTLFGILMEVSRLHPKNALLSMVVTLLGMVIELSPEQSHSHISI